MTLTGIRKHVGVLEHAELVTTEKVRQVRTCRLGPRRLEDETAWIEGQRRRGMPGSTGWSRSSRSDEGRRGTMDTRSAVEARPTRDRTTIERAAQQELVVTRTIGGPRDGVSEAWTDAELFRQWWVPTSGGLTLLSCEVDARVGGRLSADLRRRHREPIRVLRRYLEVIPPARLVWTNEEGDEGTVVTTVTFEEPGPRPGWSSTIAIRRRRRWTRRSRPGRRAGSPRRSISWTSCSSASEAAPAGRGRPADVGRGRAFARRLPGLRVRRTDRRSAREEEAGVAGPNRR